MENKKCWACKRTLVNESKIGLCPDCKDKYGSPAAILTLGAGMYVLKNGGKILKTASRIVRH